MSIRLGNYANVAIILLRVSTESGTRLADVSSSQLATVQVRPHDSELLLFMAVGIAEVRNLALNTSKNIKWHVIASIALAGSNAPEEIPHVFRYALQHDANGDIHGDTARRIARETRDGLIKAGQLMFAFN